MDFKQLLESEDFKEYAARLEEKAKTVLHGDDVIHLTYLSPLIDQQTIDILSEDFKQVNIRLGSWNDFGVIKASLEEFSLQIFLAISNPITVEILKTIGLNSIWETFKYAILNLHKKVFRHGNQKSNLISKEVNFGFKMAVSKTVKFEFKIDGDLSDELILASMDKALDFVKEHDGKTVPVIELPIYSTFDHKTHKWKKVNVLKELKKKKKK